MRNFTFGLLVCWASACLQPVTETATIGPAGGSVGTGGALLAIPQGALSSEVNITLRVVDAVAPPSGTVAVGGSVLLTPEGLRFAVPAMLELPLTREPQDISIATAPAGTQFFGFLPAEHSSMKARARISHFSVFIPVTPEDGGTDGGWDSGSDGGPADAGAVDGGEDAGGTGDAGPGDLDVCQPIGPPIRWSNITAWRIPQGPVKLIETPTGYVFSRAVNIVPLDLQLNPLESYMPTDTPDGGRGLPNWSGVSLFSTPPEVVVVGDRWVSTSEIYYAEWRVGANGRLLRNPDGTALMRYELLPGSYTNQPYGGPGPWCGYGPLRDELLVPAGVALSPTLAFVPRSLGAPVRTVPVPAPYSDSSAGVELPDGSVLFALNQYLPGLNGFTEVGANVVRVEADGGLTSLSWAVDGGTSRAPFLMRGGRSGALLVRSQPDGVSFFEMGATSPTQEVLVQPRAGPAMLPPDSTQSMRDGGVLALADVTGPVGTLMTHDLYLVRYPRGDAVPLITGLEAEQFPIIGAVRDDSFVLAWGHLDAGVFAARLCFPP